MKDIKTDFNRDHYYYHRYDPTPWIPFEEEDEIHWGKYALIVAVVAILVLIWYLS